MPVQEHLLRAEYWNGHSFEDTCGGIRPNYLGSTEEEKEKRNAHKAERKVISEYARPILVKLLEEHREPSEVIEDGLFDGTNYTIGTPLRIYEEKLHRSKRFNFGALFRSLWNRRVESLDWDEPMYLATTSLAVITESALYPEFLKRRLTSYSEYFFGEGVRGRYAFDDPARVQVGKVEHYRVIDDTYGTNDHESLRRITRIEVFRT